MATSFGLGALLRGRLEPTQLMVERPVVQLLRDAERDGQPAYRRCRRRAELRPAPLEHLLAPPQPDAPLGLLTRLKIRGATVIVDDRFVGRTWRADRVDAAIERDAAGSSGDLSLAVTLGGETAGGACDLPLRGGAPQGSI